MNYDNVLCFWFEETAPAAWWRKDSTFDALIAGRFGALLESARGGELYRWRDTAEGAFAEILVLDQFSRNIFREDARAFAQDVLALILAQEAVRRGLDVQLPKAKRHFLYIPYMHSESRLIHEEAGAPVYGAGRRLGAGFRHEAKAIVDRFGRYPQRNALLGRASTPRGNRVPENTRLVVLRRRAQRFSSSQSAISRPSECPT